MCCGSCYGSIKNSKTDYLIREQELKNKMVTQIMQLMISYLQLTKPNKSSFCQKGHWLCKIDHSRYSYARENDDYWWDTSELNITSSFLTPPKENYSVEEKFVKLQDSFPQNRRQEILPVPSDSFSVDLCAKIDVLQVEVWLAPCSEILEKETIRCVRRFFSL